MLFFASDLAHRCNVDSPWIYSLRLCIDDWFSVNKNKTQKKRVEDTKNNIIRKSHKLNFNAHAKIAKSATTWERENQPFVTWAHEERSETGWQTRRNFMLDTSPKLVNKHLNIYLSFQPNGSSRYLQWERRKKEKKNCKCSDEFGLIGESFVFVNHQQVCQAKNRQFHVD